MPPRMVATSRQTNHGLSRIHILAGYAIAKDGKTKLGFLGGMAVPAVIRYGYGFVQGADAAAAELGQNIEINYFYGGQFYGDANITSRMEAVSYTHLDVYKRQVYNKRKIN